MTPSAAHVVPPRPTSPAGASWIRVFPVRSPTLPPATHTNVYVVGTGRLAVVDPASPDPAEQEALAALVESLLRGGEVIDQILLTHHHVDHVSGALTLSRRFSLPIAAHPDTARKLEGRIAIDRILAPGERLPYGPTALECLHSPGHAPGHLCFVAGDRSAMLVGDMVASVGTIVIEPDDEGDMTEYLESLERLRALGVPLLLPAHGGPITDGPERLSFYLHHRREREQRIFDSLGATPRSLDELLPSCYPDVLPAVYPLARRSLLAHLLKLAREGRARREATTWRSA